MDGIAVGRKTVGGGMPASNAMTLRMLLGHVGDACIGHNVRMNLSNHA